MEIMYSRYLPDGNGGYRRHAQGAAKTQQAQRNITPEAGRQQDPGTPTQVKPHGELGEPPKRTHGVGPQHHPGPPSRPGTRPGPMGRPPPGGFPGGGIGMLLRGLDTEDFLILAVLLLTMKNDGASGTELLIAAALYLLLGNAPDPGR